MFKVVQKEESLPFLDHPEDGGRNLLQNGGTSIPIYKVSHARKIGVIINITVRT
jgi:hypothetical protein